METVIRDNLQKIIESERVNVSYISKKTGVSVSTLCRILSGDIKNPNRQTINQLSKYFKVPIEKLIDVNNFTEQHNNIKDRLNYLMHKSRINIEDLSILSRVSTSSIRSILMGDTQNPNLETCSKLAYFFGITVGQLKCEEELTDIIEIYKDIPVLKINNVKSWTLNQTTTLIEYHVKYVFNNNNNLFSIYIEDSSYFYEYEVGDMLIFEINNKVDIGSYIVEILGITRLIQIYSLTDKIKYRFIGSTNFKETDVDNINIFGKLLEVKVK
jgi:transcriptional regulator with XRE-family HTH domain